MGPQSSHRVWTRLWEWVSFVCVNLCVKIRPKSAKIGKINQNVQIHKPHYFNNLLKLRRL